MTFRWQSLLVALVAVPAFLLAGCGSSSASLSSIAIAPSPVRLSAGGTAQLIVTGTYSDGTRAPITSGISFASSAATVVAVSSSGVLTAMGGGTATVTATTGGVSGTVTVTVAAGPPVLESVTLVGPGVPLTPGSTAQLTVIANYSDGSQVNVTSGSTFASSASNVATVNASGLLTAVANGSATISATHTASGRVATAVVTVATAAPTLVSIAIQPTSLGLLVGGSGQLTVVGTYSDQSTVNLTASCTFVSSNLGAATVTSGGLVTAVAAGSATVTATHTASGKIASVPVAVTVLPPTLLSIAVVPDAKTIEPGATQQLRVDGTYSNGLVVDVTAGCSFASSVTAYATVSASGLVTGVATGTTTITASHIAGAKTANSIITVAPSLVSIALTPSFVGLATSGTQQLTVTGTYSDSTTANLTSSSTFASSATGVATVSAGGLVTAVASGSATVTATHTASGKTATVPVNVNGVVFRNGYASGVSFAPFGGSTNDVSIDATVTHDGLSTLKFVVTGTGSYSGGALVTATARNLTGFNALTFWAKASTANNLNVAGMGNDASGSAAYSAEINTIPLTGTWTKFAIPLPAPGKAIDVAGLFHLADAPDNYTIWLSEIMYESLPAGQVGSPTAASITWGNPTVAVGGTTQIDPASNTVTFATTSAITIGNITNVGFRWFNLTSGTPAVATVSATGLVTGVSAGTSSITATLGSLAVPGSSTVTVSSAPSAPAVAAPTPTKAAANVISMYNSSGTYTDSPGINWHADWSDGTYATYTIAGTSSVVKQYTSLNFVGLEFYANPINASSMTHLHIDVWTPNATKFGVKPVNFGTPNQEAEKQYTNPPIATGSWISLDIPLSDFTAINASMAFNNLQQMIFTDNFGTGGVERGTFFIDNVYFWSAGAGSPSTPATLPTTPSKAAANVISLYNSSGTYTNSAVTTWATSWGNPNAVTDFSVSGKAVKQYSQLVFSGVDITGVDLTTYTHMHIDVWTPDASYFGVKLVNNAGGAGTTEAIAKFGPATTPALVKGSWVSIDVPLTAFAGMAFTNVNQLLWLDNADAGAPGDEKGTFFIDNVYFYRSALTAPVTAAPTPAKAAANVLSMYNSSGTYTDSPGINWHADWSSATLAAYTIPGTSSVVKQYSSLNFVGLEFYANPINASSMTHLHIDVWTPAGTKFGVKPVNFGVANQEAEVKLFSPTISTGTWVSLDIPLSDFTALNASMGFNNLQQLLFTDNFDPGGVEGGTFFIDNVYFWK